MKWQRGGRGAGGGECLCRGKIKATSVERTHRTQGLDNARHNTITNNNNICWKQTAKIWSNKPQRSSLSRTLPQVAGRQVYCAHGRAWHISPPRLYTMNSSSSNVLRHCELHAPLNEGVLSRADFAFPSSCPFSSFFASSPACFSASHPRALNQSKGNRLESWRKQQKIRRGDKNVNNEVEH